MKTTIVAVSVALNCLAAWPLAAGAEHTSAEWREPGPSVDLDLRLERDGFRLGGRLFGLEGMYGAWLNGRLRRDGFSLDGRVQDPTRVWNFRLDADVSERLDR